MAKHKSIGVAYFFVVRQAPFHFEMVDSGAKPWPSCNRPALPGGAPGTPFPIQEWR